MKSERFLTATILMFMIFLLIGYNSWADQQFDRIDQDIAEIRAGLKDLQEQPVPYIVNEDKPLEPQEPIKVSLGIFTVTAYCPCEKCCGKWSNVRNPISASGTLAIEGEAVGADWGTIPKGSKIYIEGLGERIIQDKPAKWVVNKYDGKILDLYFASHAAALKFGKQELHVWVEK